jgi:hypothetical protein
MFVGIVVTVGNVVALLSLVDALRLVVALELVVRAVVALLADAIHQVVPAPASLTVNLNDGSGRIFLTIYDARTVLYWHAVVVFILNGSFGAVASLNGVVITVAIQRRSIAQTRVLASRMTRVIEFRTFAHNGTNVVRSPSDANIFS